MKPWVTSAYSGFEWWIERIKTCADRFHDRIGSVKRITIAIGAVQMNGQAVEGACFLCFSTVKWGTSEAFSGPRWLTQNPQNRLRPGQDPPQPRNRLLIATFGLLFSHENEVQCLFSSAASYDPWMSFPPFAFRQQPSGCASSLWCGKMSWSYCIQLEGCFGCECSMLSFKLNRHVA